MNKKELVNVIAEQLDGMTKKDIDLIITVMAEEITKALANGDSVNIAGFGKFSVVERAARDGRNPQTGEAIRISAKKAPKFSASTKLKESVNA